jgi:hypothetical protein
MERSNVARTNRCTVALKRAEWSRHVDERHRPGAFVEADGTPTRFGKSN